MKNLKIFIFAIVLALLIIAGMSMDKIKENLNWMSETDESSSSLPELSNREIEKVTNENLDDEDSSLNKNKGNAAN